MGLPTLTKDNAATLQTIDDIQRRTVEVPEWGVSIRLRGLTAGAKQAYEDSLMHFDHAGKAIVDTKDGMAKLLVQCIEDESGELVFTDKDIAVLTSRSGSVVQRLFLVAQQLSGIGQDAFVAAKNDSGGAEAVKRSSGLRSASAGSSARSSAA